MTKGSRKRVTNRRAQTPRPTVCSLFTGAGGLDIGLERAGFRTAAAVDNDADCISTLRANQTAVGGVRNAHFDGTVLIHKPVETITPEELLGACGGCPPDLMAGGPPCQPFSSSGAMGALSDPRGKLFEEFVRLTGALRPRLVLFENVRGLVTAKGPNGEPGEVLSLVQEAFEGIGYATRFALLNAADFGCPQRRVRCFMIASRDIEVPTFPEPTHTERSEPSLFGAQPSWVSLRQFLATRSEPDVSGVVRPTARLAAQLAGLPDGAGLRSAGARETTRPSGHWGYRQGTFIADQSLPARTVTASACQDWIRLDDGTLRRLTADECAGLQGFPSGWQFAGGKASQFRQIGNAVPVVFGQVIGRCLLDALERAPRAARPASAPLPREFQTAIGYTKKEHTRNGESRARVLELQRTGAVERRSIKGVGTAELVEVSEG